MAAALFFCSSLEDGLLQHQELSPAGAEEADEQDGHQERGQPLHRRHQQRGAGRAVPRHQRVHPQPQGVPEDHQEPGQDGGEAGGALQEQPVQHRGADPGGELQVGVQSSACWGEEINEIMFSNNTVEVSVNACERGRSAENGDYHGDVVL